MEFRSFFGGKQRLIFHTFFINGSPSAMSGAQFEEDVILSVFKGFRIGKFFEIFNVMNS